MSQCWAGSRVGMWRQRVLESKGSAEPLRDADRPMSKATAGRGREGYEGGGRG